MTGLDDLKGFFQPEQFHDSKLILDFRRIYRTGLTPLISIVSFSRLHCLEFCIAFIVFALAPLTQYLLAISRSFADAVN